ncbi:MAG: DUF4417 domain-containing protein [Saccharofermentans sp.]|nr:DUF4417 domain-containing protein [Saccharofermentans sp.]
MSKVNRLREGCKDVFKAFLVKDAKYEGYLEIPIIYGGLYRPAKLIEFSKALSSQDYTCWVHFYEDDASFERIWRNPNKYLPTLKKFAGVISPDFSLYRDMPLVMQLWNIYRSHAIGSWLQNNGVNVIPNIRFGDERTFDNCCCGVSHSSTIAIGTHGCIKNKIDRFYLSAGVEWIINKLEPKIVVIYGQAPAEIFDKFKTQGITILQFDSSFAKSRRGE